MKTLIALLGTLFTFSCTKSVVLAEQSPAPTFVAKKHDGTDFDLKSREGAWTVLYFYPKAGTPGCTKQACAFRDNVEKIRAQGAEVYGISTDTVEAQASFHKEHKLNFDLLADPDAKVVDLYGARKLGLKMASRWTFVIGPNLQIRKILRDVDPVIDSVKIADEIAVLKSGA